MKKPTDLPDRELGRHRDAWSEDGPATTCLMTTPSSVDLELEAQFAAEEAGQLIDLTDAIAGLRTIR
jgi:hypothetical protein